MDDVDNEECGGEVQGADHGGDDGAYRGGYDGIAAYGTGGREGCTIGGGAAHGGAIAGGIRAGVSTVSL